MTGDASRPTPRDGAPAADGTLDDLDVVFLVWRESPAMLERHHAAVRAALPPGWAGGAVLVENAAAPATTRAARELVARSYPAARRLALRMPRNAGFARAMDLALDACQGRYVALVNSDGSPDPGMFASLVAALEADPRAIWAGPAVHGPGEPDHAAGPPYADERMSGMALVIRRADFLALGGFDPLFFFYNEDFDASDRLRRAGRTLLRVPATRFHHGKGGRSWRGDLVREFWFALTDQMLVWVHDPSRRGAARRLLRARPRSLAGHLRDGDLAGAAGIAAATVALPCALAAAERRRRRPWDGARLALWLDEHRGEAERIALDG